MARGTKQKARSQRVEELLQIRYDSGEERVALALASRRLGKLVLTAHGLVKRYDPAGPPVVDRLNLELGPGDRIGIVGPNGAGKSTLLDLLAGRLIPDAGTLAWGDTVKVGYFDQRSADLDDRLRILEFIEHEAALIRTADGERVEAAQMLEWFLFPRPLQQARIGSLSGGERRRLYLLRTLVHQPNVLLLDEPTNDLDIQTLTVLEEFLDHFGGALVVVSHDRYFLDRTVDFLVAMENGRLGPRLPAPYEVFARLREGEHEPAPPADAAQPLGKPGSLRRPPSSRLTWKEQRELEAVEARIAELEARRKLLLDEINEVCNNYAQLHELSNTLNNLDLELDAVLERWFQLSEKA
jgi:ATP-binding cassette subfamily F protein uup